MCLSCLDDIWIIKHLIWEAQTSSHWHQPVQTPLCCREHLHMQGRDWGRVMPGNSLEKVQGCVFSVCPTHIPVAPNQTREWRPPDPAWTACLDLPPGRANNSGTWSWWHWRVFLPAAGLLHVFLTLQCKGMPWANTFCNMHLLHWDSAFVYSSEVLWLYPHVSLQLHQFGFVNPHLWLTVWGAMQAT